jgi:Mg2+ and Co2+ transporter CorA
VALPLTPQAPSQHPAQLPSGKMASCTVFKGGHATDVSQRLGQISDILEEKETFVWFDVVDPGPNDLDVLRQEFDLYPLAIEDANHAHQRPKIDSYGRYWFLDVQATSLENDDVEFHEIAIFAGTNFVVTVRHDPEYPLDAIKERWNAHPEGMERGAGFLLYTILDTIVDGYMPVGEVFSDKVDALEEMLFRTGRPAGTEQVLPQIFGMKKDAQHFRRAVLPMRDILNPIIRKDIELFPGLRSRLFSRCVRLLGARYGPDGQPARHRQECPRNPRFGRGESAKRGCEAAHRDCDYIPAVDLLNRCFRPELQLSGQ